MNRRARTGAGTNLVRGARMIAIGQQDLVHAKADKFLEICSRRLNGIDAEISVLVKNEVTVEVITVRFGKPGPGVDAA